MNNFKGTTVSLDTETIHGYVGVWYTVNEKNSDKYNKMYRPISNTNFIEKEEITRLREELSSADAVVIHNVRYDACILNLIFKHEKTGISVSEVKKLNDWLFQKEDKFAVEKYQERNVRELFSKYGVLAVCTLDILSNQGKGAFIGLKTLQNAFNLKVDKHVFTDETRLTDEFLQYFENDVISLREIWNKHWQFASTYKNRKKALELLDINPESEVVYGGLSKFLSLILGNDTEVLPYEFVEAFEKKPMPECALEFEEHSKYVWENIGKILDKSIIPEEQKGFRRTVNFLDNNVDYSMGGIHSVSTKGKLFRKDDDYLLLHIDVASLYPSIILANKHLFRFIKIQLYEYIKKERIVFKHNGKIEESNAFKLILNALYGIINSMMGTTVTNKTAGIFICMEGHRLILRMVDYLLKHLTNMELVQLNTDGIYVKVLRTEINNVKEAIVEWEKETGMEMDIERFDYIFQENVNNYIAKETKKGHHRKGKFSKNFKSYHNTSCPRTVRDMVVNLLDDKDPMDVDIIGIFDTVKAQNYYLTTKDKGEIPLTPKGNPKKIGGTPHTYITFNKEDAVKEEYLKLAEYVLDEGKLKTDLSMEKVKMRAIKNREDFYKLDPMEQLHKIGLNHNTARKKHVELGFNKTMTKREYRKYLENLA